MKVLIIQPWIKLGGAELISVHLAFQLGIKGHDVSIVSTFHDPEGMPREASQVKIVLPGKWLSRMCQRSRLFFLAFAPWILFGLVWKYSKDVEVLNPHNFPSMWVAVLVGAMRRTPVVWTCNEPPERLPLRDALTVGLGDYLGWLVASSFIDRLLAARVGLTYVPSSMTRKHVLDRYGIDASVIPIGLDAAFFQGGRGDALREQLGLDGAFVMLSVGKLHPQKNQIVSLEALKRIIGVVPSALLLLAGDGAEAARYREVVVRAGLDGHVRFLGHVGSETVRDLYAASHLNLFTPLNQSYGLTPFEALCAGTLSIVSSDCGAAEIFEQESLGVVCQPDPDELAAQIIDVYSNMEKHQSTVERGGRYVSESLTWEQHAGSVLQLFEEAARGRKITTQYRAERNAL